MLVEFVTSISFVDLVVRWFRLSSRMPIWWAREGKIQANQIALNLGKDQTDATTTRNDGVKKPQQHLSILAAMTGTGCQLLFVTCVIIG